MMTFAEKNTFVMTHKSVDHYDADIRLFNIHCPRSRLHSDLRRVNSFTRAKLDGLMLLELLSRVSPEQILSNRIPAEEEPSPEPDETPLSLDNIKQLITDKGHPADLFHEPFLHTLVGKPIGYVNPVIAHLIEMSVTSTCISPTDSPADTGVVLDTELNPSISSQTANDNIKDPEVEQLRSELTEKDETIDELQNEAEEKEETIDELQEENERMQEQIDQLTAEKNKKKGRSKKNSPV